MFLCSAKMGSSWLVKTVPFPIRIICCSHSKHKNKFRVRGCLEQYPHILLWDQFCGETTISIMHPGSELKQNSRQKCVCQSLNPSEMLGWTYSRSGFEFCLDTPWIDGFGLLTKFCCAFPQTLSKWRRRERGLTQKLTNTHIRLHNNKRRRITLTQTNMHTSWANYKMPNILISQT